MFSNKALSRIFEPKGKEVAGENCIMGGFIIFTPLELL
jgi:hypothetical protein